MSREFEAHPADDAGRTHEQWEDKTYYFDEDTDDLMENDISNQTEALVTWKDNGEVEVNYGLSSTNIGALVTRENAPELSDEALSNWDVFLRFRNGRIEIMFGGVKEKSVLPDDDPNYYDDMLPDF